MRTRTLREQLFTTLAVDRNFIFDPDKHGLGVIISRRVLANLLNGVDISLRGISPAKFGLA